MDPNWLEIVGAAEHNLKHVDLRIPKGKFVVFSGVSGSGKTSLAFDTIYVEGQRKYIESLSSYARQFLGQLERPRYDRMSGLSPTVAIEQKKASSNPRSTVGTVTEIVDYLRILFARAGEQRCPRCGRRVGKQDPQQVVAALAAHPEGTAFTLLSPLVRGRKGEFRQLFEELLGQGFVRFRVDGEIRRLEQAIALEKNRKHDLDIVVDRVKVGRGIEARLTDSVETALKAGKGRMIALGADGKELAFSEELYCDVCGVSLPELSPQLFSFNNPLGACPECNGIGTGVEMDTEQILSPADATLAKALQRLTVIWIGRRRGWRWRFWTGMERVLGLTPHTRIGDLTAEQKRQVVYGFGEEKDLSGELSAAHFPGLWAYVQRDLLTTQSEAVREWYTRYLRESRCAACEGTRLRPEARSVYLEGNSIADLTAMSVQDLSRFFRGLELGAERGVIAAEPVREVLARLQFLEDVGLPYLTLDRRTHTLSGGEAQRIRLARQLGSELSGVIYILDEPSVGLHQRDGLRLIRTLERLRDLGNTILVVEHDRETMRHADWVVDFGPDAGRLGGEVVYSGELEGLWRCAGSVTGAYLSGRREIPVPKVRREPRGWLRFAGVCCHNLRGVEVRIPLGVFTVVSGVSGAGKSSLVAETVRPLLEQAVNRVSVAAAGRVEKVEGLSQVGKVITIDQQPIGRTPRSNPATYTKLFDVIRGLFASTREAKAYGYGPGRFSFNVKGGRCEHCKGDGSLKIEMHFLPDVYVTCPQCKGKRFNDATLRVRYRERDISQVLEMTVEEGVEFFAAVPSARRILKTMQDVGLGYLTLGQPSPTLSGGEAQRIKLSRELARREREHTFYILDEPTTGLHFHDIAKLLSVVGRLTDAGHSVLMVEHNLDIIKCADWVIDLGPEGGDLGGQVVVAGTPERVAACLASYTGKALREGVNERRKAKGHSRAGMAGLT